MSDIVAGNLTGRVTVVNERKITDGNLTDKLSEKPALVFSTNNSDRVTTLEISASIGMNSTARSFKFIKSISIGGPTDSNTDSSFGRNLICGISKETVEGSPSSPSLKISQNAIWRFRWAVQSGARTISIKCKQAINLSPRPTMTIKANSSIGINSDLIATASSNVGWVTIGPISFTAIGSGLIYVELSNNLIDYTDDVNNGGNSDSVTYFDHIVVT